MDSDKASEGGEVLQEAAIYTKDGRLVRGKQIIVLLFV